MTRSRRFLAALLAIAALTTITACGYDPSKHSTEGVVLIDEEEGIAALPIGETLVLRKRQSCGKSTCTYYWRFVADIENRVTVTTDRLFEDRVRSFAVTNDGAVEIDTGWLNEPLYASLSDDGTVLIDWPTGFWSRWSYREYNPPQ